MLLKDSSKRKGVVSLIIKKMAGGDSYESMKDYNEHNSEVCEHAQAKKDMEHKDDYSAGYNAAAEEMISAFRAGDAGMLKSALMSFLDMYENEEYK